jgi:ribosomal protein S3AE
MAESQVIKKKKKWINIFANPEFNNIEVGETLANEDTNLIGRTIETNLANITQDPKSQNIKIRFRVREIKDNKAYANAMSYEMLSTYVKRIVRPAKEKVDDSFEYKTKEGIKIKIKTIFLTKAKTIKSILTNLRHQSRGYLTDYCNKSDYKTLINDLASHNLQRDLKNVLKKIYPLNVCEVRMMQRI